MQYVKGNRGMTHVCLCTSALLETVKQNVELLLLSLFYREKIVSVNEALAAAVAEAAAACK